jgi:hypothetical protein
MKNSKKIQTSYSQKRMVWFITLSTAVLFLSTSYSQAGFISETNAPPAPFMARQIVAPHFPGRTLAYEARPIASAGSPGSLLGQGNAARPSSVTAGVVEGFADQIPLSIAMQQVLPQGYVYALGDGVNPGQLVSWRGGRQWQSVVGDMLGASGLGYSVNGQVVTISNLGSTPAVIGGPPAVHTMPPASAYAASMTPPGSATAPVMYAPQSAPQVLPPPQSQFMAPQPQAMVPPPSNTPMMTASPGMIPPGQPGAAPVMPQAYGTAPAMGYGSAVMMDGAMADAMQMQPASYAPQSWEARPGQTLRKLLQDWCARAGTELSWQAEYDYPIMASFNMAGTFEEAVRMLLSGFHGAKPVPYGRLHYNPAIGQSILIVQAAGNHYGD